MITVFIVLRAYRGAQPSSRRRIKADFANLFGEFFRF
jgi:hypothetical protein